MKFSLKLLLCTMIVMALGFGFSGFYFVNYVFETAMDREVAQALDDNSILRFAFETAALNVPAKYDVLQDNTIREIDSNLEAAGHTDRRMLRLYDEQKQVLYASIGFDADNKSLDQTASGTKTYRVIKLDGGYYIQAGTMVNALDRALYLETLRDV
ncbi:MAG: sensor histidine kinase, partial [Clostridiales bacterium]|nr:sensor histidine kinase [Clostridiales bacterium]